MTRAHLRPAAAVVAAGLTAPVILASVPASGSAAPAAHGTLAAAVAAPPSRSGGHDAALRAVRHPGASERVIVLLQDQPAVRAHSATALAMHADTLQRAQAPVVARLAGLRARKIHGYRFINAVSATVTRGQAARLAVTPGVRAVVPDHRVSLPGAEPRAAGGTGTSTPDPNAEPGICPSGHAPQVEPEALSRIHANAVPGGITGHGVKIAVFPDGFDKTLADFQRPGGGSVISDYRDFTGEGMSAVTGGGEAFGDVSSIAAQGNTTYDLANVVNPDLPLPGPCPIVVKGAAPGATVDVMKVFGSTSQSFDSVILRGMDWAVSHDHVDVLSESFGINSVAQPADDPISLFNAQAVKDGITVVASTGDAGTSNTIGSPASSTRSGVISVGGSTALRAAAQLGLYAAPASSCWSSCGQGEGWQDDNVASLSSSGTTEYGPATVDVLAPGDAGWAVCSTNRKRFTDCANPFRKDSTPGVELFGGTSESAPLTSATAALVIQAYRSAHGATPSPALVKQVIASTARPLPGVPAAEQGAGLVDATAAVAMARHASWAGDRSLLVGRDQVGRVGDPGQAGPVTIPVTNDGEASSTVTPSLVTLSAPQRIAGGTFRYDPSSRDRAYPRPTSGAPVVADLESVPVPGGVDRLVVRASWSQTGSRYGEAIEVSLIDPAGRLVNASDPQGPAGFAEVEAASPQAGTWRVAVQSSETGYAGPVTWEADSQTASSEAAGKPVTLKPNEKGSVTVPFGFSTTPGDQSRAIQLTDSATGRATQLALLTRTRIPVAAGRRGHFSGAFTGGNGRQYFYAQEIPYQFTVPRGAPAINVNLELAHAGYDVIAYLVDPRGTAVDAQSTVVGASARGLSSTRAVHLSWLAPRRGTWHLDLALLGNIRSQRTSTGFAGTVDFTRNRVRVHGLPHSTRTRLRRSKVVRARVTVTNHGNSPAYYFLDPRLTTSAVQPLQPLDITGGRLPITYRQIFPVFVLPPFSSALALTARASRPVSLETFPTDPVIASIGAPDAVSPGVPRRPKITLTGRDLASGGYACAPQLPGPAPAAGAGTGRYTCDAAGRSAAFAKTVTAATGSPWRHLHRWHPVRVAPGRTRSITLRIKPSGRSGAAVRGFVAVESFSWMAFGTDVLAKLPFAYRNG